MCIRDSLYSDVLQEYAARIRECLRPGGWFAFSGCPERRGDPTRGAAERAGLRVEEVRRRGRWLTFLGRRPR